MDHFSKSAENFIRDQQKRMGPIIQFNHNWYGWEGRCPCDECKAARHAAYEVQRKENHRQMKQWAMVAGLALAFASFVFYFA